MKTFDDDREADLDRERIRVGVSQSVTVEDGETLVAYGVGSGVAVAVYDPAGVGALANTVLPESSAGADGATAKFVDTAVQAIVREVAAAGGSLADVRAWIVGGAEIMDLEDLEAGVGAENVRAARSELSRLGVPVEGEAVGGDRGRVVEFDTESGRVEVRTVDDPEPTPIE